MKQDELSELEKAVRVIHERSLPDPGPGSYWCFVGPDWKAAPEAEDGPVGLFRANGSCVLAMPLEVYKKLYKKLSAEFGPAPGEPKQ